ncbi:uncharacterized protein LOC132205713 [Neocloeon triangulifer]|uniref:uncharacterized protein LOC132205713 n=1 Tax=Neocloeon triangulifer TaxID=2078957 RepID=UPI00286EB65A|nr:uncharacterized protein LOC132205713 [Neocloeon triangulifer]
MSLEQGQQQGSSSWMDRATSWIRLNIDHFKTIPGMLKLAQIVFGIICIACSSPTTVLGTVWFIFVAGTAITVSFIWILIYFFSIKDFFRSINWNREEMLCFGLVTVLYLTAFITQLAVWSPAVFSNFKISNLVAGSFGVLNFVAYGGSTGFAYVEWRAQPNMMNQWPASQQNPPLPEGPPVDYSAPAPENSSFKLDMGYLFTTPPGISKSLQILFCIISLACASPALLPGTHWFLIVTSLSLVSTIFWSVINVFCLKDGRHDIRWNLGELVSFGCFTILHLTAFITQLAIWSPWYLAALSFVRDPNLAAGSFGLFNFVAHCSSVYFAYMEWKSEPNL